LQMNFQISWFSNNFQVFVEGNMRKIALKFYKRLGF
jgi:hypothetical protein